MKLYASPTSPYARLVRAVSAEKQLDSRIEFTWVDPWASGDELLGVNPFSRVPVLETDDGAVLTEALLISLYLERRFPEPRLVPLDRVAEVYRRLGLGQGVLDAAVAIVATRKFHADADEQPVVQRRFEALHRSLPSLAEAVRAPTDRPDLGDLALAVAMGYLDFRLPEIPWREKAPTLAEWYAVRAARPSLESTRPDR